MVKVEVISADWFAADATQSTIVLPNHEPIHILDRGCTLSRTTPSLNVQHLVRVGKGVTFITLLDELSVTIRVGHTPSTAVITMPSPTSLAGLPNPGGYDCLARCLLTVNVT